MDINEEDCIISTKKEDHHIVSFDILPPAVDDDLNDLPPAVIVPEEQNFGLNVSFTTERSEEENGGLPEAPVKRPAKPVIEEDSVCPTQKLDCITCLDNLTDGKLGIEASTSDSSISSSENNNNVESTESVDEKVTLSGGITLHSEDNAVNSEGISVDLEDIQLTTEEDEDCREFKSATIEKRLTFVKRAKLVDNVPRVEVKQRHKVLETSDCENSDLPEETKVKDITEATSDSQVTETESQVKSITETKSKVCSPVSATIAIIPESSHSDEMVAHETPQVNFVEKPSKIIDEPNNEIINNNSPSKPAVDGKAIAQDSGVKDAKQPPVKESLKGEVLEAYDIIDRTELKGMPASMKKSEQPTSFFDRMKSLFTGEVVAEGVKEFPKPSPKPGVRHEKAVVQLSVEQTNDGEAMQVITLSHVSNKRNIERKRASMVIYVDGVKAYDDDATDGVIVEVDEIISDAESDKSCEEENEEIDEEKGNTAEEGAVEKDDDIFKEEDGQGFNTLQRKPVIKRPNASSFTPAPTPEFNREARKSEPSRRLTTSDMETSSRASIATDSLFRHTLPFIGGGKTKKKTLPLDTLKLFTDAFPTAFPSHPTDRRSLIALEMYTTERSYVRGLEVVVHLFMKQLEQNNAFDAKDIKTVFSNISLILDLNKEILDALFERISSWSDDQCVGDIFLAQQDRLKIYANYCTNYDASEAFLKHRLKKKKDIETILSTCYTNPACMPGLTLSSYLITVIQRIPRYILLLRDLIKKTPSDHRDYENLTNAQVVMEKLAAFLNDQLKQAQCAKALKLLQTQITGLRAYYTPERNLVHEGTVCLQTTKKQYQCVLFNDLLVFANKGSNKQSAVELPLNLNTVWLEDLQNLDPQTIKNDAIGIYTPDRSYTMYVNSAGDKKIWMGHLKKTILQHLHGATEDTCTDERTCSYTYKDGTVYSGTFCDAKRNGEGTMMWPNQMTYRGSWEDDERNGKGVLEYFTGEVYDGQWKNDLQDGEGTFTYTNGDKVTCDWKKGKRHGKASIEYSNGDRFTGRFMSDRIEGHGELVCKNGVSYSGSWRRNLKHGQGEMTNSDGSQYSGCFVRGKYHGHGKFTAADGSVYEGEFERGEKCGEGSLTTVHGETYTGQWENNTRSGKGRMVYANGDQYEGTWYQDMRIGQGVMTYTGGWSYRGQWQDDLRHGSGVMESQHQTYDGEWVKNQMCGFGTMKHTNGETFKGDWRDNIQNGKGILTRPNGWYCDGTWVQGKQNGRCKLHDPINEYEYEGDWLNGMKEGAGRETTKHSSYVGQFVADLREGRGKEKFSNETTYEGRWGEGQKHGRGVKKLVSGVLEHQRWHRGQLVKSPVLLTPVHLPDLHRY